MADETTWIDSEVDTGVSGEAQGIKESDAPGADPCEPVPTDADVGEEIDDEDADRDDASAFDADRDVISPRMRRGREVLTRAVNSGVWGLMVVQYPERDVRVSMDGDAALRLLAMYAGGSPGRYQDTVDPGTSDAQCIWIGVDLTRALGLFWMPSDLIAAGRTTIDPLPAELATA